MEKVSKIMRWLFLAMFLIVATYGLLGEILLPDERTTSDDVCQLYNEGWQMVAEDGTQTPIKVPGKYESGDPNGNVITNQLPDEISEGMFLIFRSSKQDMRIYVDDELRSEYSTVDSRWFGKASPTYYVYVELHPEDAGKSIVVYYHSISLYAGVVSDIYFANHDGFMNYMLSTQGIILVVAIMMLVVGLFSLIISQFFYLFYKSKQKLTSISVGICFLAFWMIGNSGLRQFVFPNVSVISDITFLMVAFLPFPFASYINNVQQEKHFKVFFVVKALTILNIMVSIVLYMAGVKELLETFYLTTIVLLILACAITVTIILDIVSGFIKKYMVTAIAMFTATLIMLIQLVVYQLTDLTFDVSAVALGLFLLLVVALVDSIRDIYILNKERQIAIAENSAKSQFLANMSHEIRTPINAVLGMNTMILRECTDDRIRRYALDIQSAGKNLLSLINDILDFSKIESGKMSLTYIDYNMAILLHDVINLTQQKATDKGLVFETDIDETIPCNYLGDDVRVRQILTNLLSNAVKYTPKGKIVFSVRKETDEETGEIVLWFSVKDTGMGIKTEDIEKLTSKFVRVDESRNRNIEGTGLGLSIVVSLLRMMGSELFVESEYGKGSNFYFKLRQTVTNKEPMGDLYERVEKVSVEDDEEIGFTCPKARVLVVDDNAINCRVFKHLLRKYDCQVDEADSGKQCLFYVGQNHYDIIFMDHMMPHMDGIETFKRMKDLGEYINADTPVIALTANAIVGAKEMYMEVGFDDYLSKPVEIASLDRMIEQYIRDDKKEFHKIEKKKGSIEIDEKEFPYVDGVDWKYALLKLSDTEIIKESLNGFLATTSIELEKMQQLYEDLIKDTHPADYAQITTSSMDAFRIQVHSMKTTAATIGAIHVAGLAKYVEYAAKENDMPMIQRLLPVFEKEWKALSKALDENFGANANGNDQEQVELPPIDHDKLLEMLNSLSIYMVDLNIDPADEIIEKLHEYSYEEEEKVLLDKLSAHVMNMDQKSCEEVITEWKNL